MCCMVESNVRKQLLHKDDIHDAVAILTLEWRLVESLHSIKISNAYYF